MQTLEILAADASVLAHASGAGEIALVYRPDYAEGDRVAVTCAVAGHYWLALDDGIRAALVYMRPGRHEMLVPFDARRKTYPPRAFTGGMHRLWLRPARHDEVLARRDLALNPWDDHGATILFPHASANVETRGEAVFAARNAIDGECANDDHGFWPFTSWGINRDPEAALTLDFGRPVRIDEIALTLRADFPHDAWWQQASVTFPDGDTIELKLEKTGAAQSFALAPREIIGLRLHSLIKADDPSPYPALSRIEVFGVDLSKG